MKGVRDWAIECLKKPETECQEGEGRKTTTLRVIKLDPLLTELSYGYPELPRFVLGSVNVGEYEV